MYASFLIAWFIVAVTAFEPDVSKSVLTNEGISNFISLANGSSLVFNNRTHLLCSTDHGHTWVTVRDVSKLEGEKVYQNIMTDDNYDTRAFYVYYKTIYATFDSGKTWNKTVLAASENFRLTAVQSHPTNSSVLLAVGQIDLKNHSSAYESYISVDYGKTYQRINVSINDIPDAHEENCEFRELGNPGKSTVRLLCPYVIQQTGSYKIKEGNGKVSDDLGETFQNVTLYPPFNETVSPLAKTPNYSIMQHYANPLSYYHNATIYISDDEVNYYIPYLDVPGNYEKLKVVELLGKRLLVTADYPYIQGYQDILPPLFFLSDSTGQKFANIGMASESDPRGLVFTIESLPGTAILTELLHGSGSSNISTDNGMTWKSLKLVDKINPHNYTCNISSPNCSFVVTGVYENFVTGTIFASGHENMVDPNFVDIDMYTQKIFPGKHFYNLSPDDKQSVFVEALNEFIAISNDGGATWRKLFQNSYDDYKVGSYGNIIVAPIEEDIYVKQLNYSIDQGMNWETLNIDTLLDSFEFLVNNPNNISSNFTFIGVDYTIRNQTRSQKNYPDYWNIYTLDFSKMYNGDRCNSTNGLVKFSLNNGGCVNGARYVSYAKNATSQCSLSIEDIKWNITSCDKCTIMDYICTQQFIRNSKGICVPDEDYLYSLGIHCVNNSTKVTPMVLVADNQCKNPLEISPVPISC